MKTTIKDSRIRRLRIVPDKPLDTRPDRQWAPVHLPRPDTMLLMPTVDPQPTAQVVIRQTHRRRWTRTFWAVAFTVFGQLAIGAAIALGGAPLLGAIAVVAITICGLGLIAAEVTINRSADTDEVEPVHEALAATRGVER